MSIKKIVFFISIIFLLFVINDLSHSIYFLWQKSYLIDSAKHELAAEKKKNSDLKKSLEKVGMPQFVEEEARNKLFLVKPGEGIVVVAPTEYMPTPKQAEMKKKDMRPNWEKWRDLFWK